MTKIIWDAVGEHLFETGTDRGVLYPILSAATYDKGIGWNGLTGVTESPSGADETKLFADNKKYLGIRAAEDFGGTITAYTYPDEWEACDGGASPVKGVRIFQQNRKPFGLSYRTLIGNDTEGEAHGYKIHLVYNATCSPASRDYKTVNDSPEAIEMSWEFTTTPVDVSGYKPTSHLEIDSTVVDAEKLKKLEDMLYGTESEEPKLPLPEEVFSILGTGDSSHS